MKKTFTYLIHCFCAAILLLLCMDNHAQIGATKKRTAVIKMKKDYKGSAIEVITPTDDLKGVVVKTADNSTWFLDRKEAADSLNITINDEYWTAPEESRVIYYDANDVPSENYNNESYSVGKKSRQVAPQITINSKRDSSETPLIIINGKEATDAIIKALPPSKIQSINVLKDVEATKKYGAKGKNGVVVISTKQ